MQVSIRPEDIQLVLTRDSDELVQAKVLLDEPLTLYRIVTVKVGDGLGSTANMRVLAGRDVKLSQGQQVWLRFNPSKFHLFDRETGNLRA